MDKDSIKQFIEDTDLSSQETLTDLLSDYKESRHSRCIAMNLKAKAEIMRQSAILRLSKAEQEYYNALNDFCCLDTTEASKQINLMEEAIVNLENARQHLIKINDFCNNLDS